MKVDKMPADFNQSMDSIAKYIKNNFQTESDRIRAVFYWTAHTISYDADNMFEVKFDETLNDRTIRAFNSQKGNCFDYANIFNNLATAVGIKSMVVNGYTKWNKQRVDNLSHSWNAARIDNKWFLFDPTWGSGYVINGVFTRSLNNNHFKVDPEIMVVTHMPFDYLWQFRDFPIINQEFIDGVYDDDKTKKSFDFVAEIARFESLPKVDQYLEMSQRIEKGGMKNQFISMAYIDAMNRRNYEKDKENRAKFEVNLSKIKEIEKQYNEAVKNYFDFSNYRKRQFQPLVSDKEIRKKIQEPRDELAKCKVAICDIEFIGDQNKANLDNLDNNISKYLAKAEEQLQFVNLYLSKPESIRKTMVYSIVGTVSKPN
ncbi:transglutaminase domain-containing protein [Flavobacterium sp. WC2509]|uniref:transglutaminase domain-containing protein n=1 Tax=Flavobacterium sp. WC2509 TaxID=3461406 RepID=UPI004044FA1E